LQLFLTLHPKAWISYGIVPRSLDMPLPNVTRMEGHPGRGKGRKKSGEGEEEEEVP
jgi:hypothetical protein